MEIEKAVFTTHFIACPAHVAQHNKLVQKMPSTPAACLAIQDHLIGWGLYRTSHFVLDVAGVRLP